MARYVEGSDRDQVTLLPECLDDYIAEDNPGRAVDAFVEELDLEALGFAKAAPAHTGRLAYHPGVLLKIYIYGYLNRVASSRRLERECQRNVELMWLTTNDLALRRACANPTTGLFQAMETPETLYKYENANVAVDVAERDLIDGSVQSSMTIGSSGFNTLMEKRSKRVQTLRSQYAGKKAKAAQKDF